MILIADSGSTKTDWRMIGSDTSSVHTQGINPYHQSGETIKGILHEELLPHVPAEAVEAVYFYGSGVRREMEALMSQLLAEAFPNALEIEPHSDLLGAARALCGRCEGIAAILGTGANSCLYDGSRIVKNMPALGYILGDEGSGAVLGKRFLHNLYSGILSEELVCLFESEMRLSLPEVIHHVYREPMPNRFLASLSEFIRRHIDDNGLRTLVYENFADFFSVHIKSYGRADLPVSFVGSIAWYYQDLLQGVAEELGFSLGKVQKSPLEGLASYHLM